MDRGRRRIRSLSRFRSRTGAREAQARPRRRRQGAAVLPATHHRGAKGLLQGTGSRRRDSGFRRRRPLTAGAHRRLVGCRHGGLRAHAAHAGQGPGRARRDRAWPLPGNRGRRQEGREVGQPEGLQGHEGRRYRAGLLNQRAHEFRDGEGGPHAERRLLHRHRLGGVRTGGDPEGRDRGDLAS